MLNSEGLVALGKTSVPAVVAVAVAEVAVAIAVAVARFLLSSGAADLAILERTIPNIVGRCVGWCALARETAVSFAAGCVSPLQRLFFPIHVHL